jgi:hypothetical protein
MGVTVVGSSSFCFTLILESDFSWFPFLGGTSSWGLGVGGERELAELGEPSCLSCSPELAPLCCGVPREAFSFSLKAAAMEVTGFPSPLGLVAADELSEPSCFSTTILLVSWKMFQGKKKPNENVSHKCMHTEHSSVSLVLLIAPILSSKFSSF